MKNKISPKTLKDTGERMIPEFSMGRVVYGEHIVRYESILPLVKDKVVLDIASGSGYGSQIISSVAKKVIGVDVDTEAVAYSKHKYPAKNLQFLQGDGVKIPLDDNSVDVVVSFETIEHIEDYVTFMQETKRILKPDGIFILSTPNDIEYSVENHFHIHEFQKTELENLVKMYYKYAMMYVQVDWVYSSLMKESDAKSEWRRKLDTINKAPVSFEKALYFMVIASNVPIEEEIDQLSVISEHWSERRNREKEMHFKKHMDDQADIITHFKNELNHSKEVVKLVKSQLKDTDEELTRIKSSKVWKAGSKIKAIGVRLKNK